MSGNLAKTNQNKKRIDLVQLVSCGTIGILGEILQKTPLKNTWIADHFSDIGIAGVFTSCGILIYGRNKLIRFLSATIPPALLTLHEYFPKLVPTEGSFDEQDIKLYWLTSAIVYMNSEIERSPVIQKCLSDFYRKYVVRKTPEELYL